MSKIKDFIKKETVLCISAILAVLSMFAVKPSVEYLSYIDFHTISLLFCLMAVMAGLRKCGLFSTLADKMLSRTKTTKQVALILVMLCFFTAMLITNDIALITFVPFTLEVLKKAQKQKDVVFVVVMQTIAANLGSMLTPIGNPQNLYLYSLSGMSLWDFIKLMLPYTIVSLIMLLICTLFIKSANITYEAECNNIDKKHTPIYLVLFAICLMTVAGIIPHIYALAITVIVIIIINREVFLKVDYSLLLTFIFFFIFIGNMGNIPTFRNAVATLLQGREVLVSVISSQIISNVPAAVLLSGFTKNINALIIGTNLGGLGTLIASMASLISYKFFVAEFPEERKKYFLQFTLWNIIFLAILIAFHIIK